jgi:hypothetical protein
MAYVLDANVFIQAKNLHYGLDFCPGQHELVAASGAVRIDLHQRVLPWQ